MICTPPATRANVLAVLLAAMTAPAGAADPIAGTTTVLGPFTGFDAPLHPDNRNPGLHYYGTDLGWSYAHGGKIHFIFGDSHSNDRGETWGVLYDDIFGTIDLAEWPDPSRIGPGNLPLLRIGRKAGTPEPLLIDPEQPLEEWKTPVGAFSNGRHEFGMFITGKPQACSTDRHCPAGFTCDTGLGHFGVFPNEDAGLTLACSEEWPDCKPDPLPGKDGQPVPNSGVCVDRGSSMAGDSPFGRAVAGAMKMLVGTRDPDHPEKYVGVKDWFTTRFINVASRPVADFVPERGAGRANQDYRNTPGKGANQRVFLWGRPWFVGVNARNQTLSTYFAYVDMPSGPGFEWEPKFYIGSAPDGTPRFSSNQTDAVPLDLDSTQPGVQAAEAHDLVQHMSIVWIEALQKWVMFYGGGVSRFPYPGWAPECGVLELFAREQCRHVNMGNGALRMRTADDPWGPWSPPQDLIVAGDPYAAEPAHQYGPGGVLHHPACKGERCQPPSAQMPVGDYGWFYGANIIEEWIMPTDDGVDVLWLASTWNPYRVVLLRSSILRGDAARAHP